MAQCRHTPVSSALEGRGVPPHSSRVACRRTRGRCRTVCVRAAFLRDLFGGGLAGEPAPRSSDAAAPAPPPLQLSPTYTVLRRAAGYELRVYDPFVAARTAYTSRADGLQRLAEYLDGRANAGGVKLPATSPVFTVYSSSPGAAEGDDDALTKHMELLVSLPPGQAQPPSPSAGSGVELVVGGGGQVLAVVELRGNVTPEVASAARARLVGALARDGLDLLSEEVATQGFRLATYGPLFSLAPRLNELMVRVRLG